MGMFDSIEFETACPNCGEMVSGFQSKDGPCCLYNIPPHEVKNFYSSCPRCSAWVSCTYIPPEGIGTIEIAATNTNPDGTKAEKVSTVKWDPLLYTPAKERNPWQES